MSRANSLSAIAAVLIAGIGTSAFADTALTSGQTASLSLNPGAVSSNYYIDVDSSAKALTVALNGSGGDLDVFVRYATPFPEQVTTVLYPTVDEIMLNHYAHYRSISSISSESLTVLPDNRYPLKAGRWYISVVNSASSGIGAGTLSATVSTTTPVGSITLDFLHPSTDASDPTNDCDDSFWTDTTAATPVGGNPGTTLGDQRKNALTYASQQLVTQLGIQVPIIVHACGAHLGGDSKSAVLAHAGPTTFTFDTADSPTNSLPKKYTWYPAVLLARLNGSSLCSSTGGPCDEVSNAAIEAVFNEDFGNADVLDGEQFYFGYTPNTPGSGDVDFISVAMHEMTHGLGFIGLVNTDPTQGALGAKAGISADGKTIDYDDLSVGPFDDIFDDSVAIVDASNTYQPFLGYEVTGSRDDARATAMVSGPVVASSGTYNPGLFTGIRWSDPTAAKSTVNIHSGSSPPDEFPGLYAPCDKSKTTTCSTQPSSTLSHTVQAGDMMNAYYSDTNLRSMGLAVPMLAPEGWSTAQTTSPTFATPIPSAWYDRTHSGHGFDFRLFAHDAVHGDVYGMLFYTFDANGKREWYQAVGNLVDGVFVPSMSADGSTFIRITYDTTPTSVVSYSQDTSVAGSVIVDFNQANASPACRNVDRTGAAQLAVMSWTIGNDSADWCVEPIVPTSEDATPDYNGVWYAPSDSGWGFEFVDIASTTGGAPFLNVLIYLPGPDNKSNWLSGSGTLQGLSANLQLKQVNNGYCRTCTPPASLTADDVGTMLLTLSTPNPGNGFSTVTATINVSYPGGGSFNRTNIPVVMLSMTNPSVGPPP
jgi:hypothetical protein